MSIFSTRYSNSKGQRTYKHLSKYVFCPVLGLLFLVIGLLEQRSRMVTEWRREAIAEIGGEK